MSTKITATWRSSPPSLGRCCSAAAATSRPTCLPNRSRTRSRSRSPATIELKPRCNSPSSVPSNTTTLQSRSPCSTCLSAVRTTRTGVAVSHDTVHIKMKPTSSATIAKIHTATANYVSVRFRNDTANIASNAIPTTGSDPRNHTIISRPMIPAVSRRGGGPASSAWAATGRSANSVSR
jgi:hypothetical protein